MVRKIEIENFKSIRSLNFELGRLNVIIGANGSGKSNILEAIAFASCAAENKLDNDYLNLRGIRVTDKGEMMKNGFSPDSLSEDILIRIKKHSSSFLTVLNFKGEDYIEWYDKNVVNSIGFNRILKMNQNFSKERFEKLLDDLNQSDLNLYDFKNINLKYKNWDSVWSNIDNNNQMKNLIDFKNFLIYSPETSSLRKFEDEGKTEPIGIRGEGLFKLLKVTLETNPNHFNEIKKNLKLLDWFESVSIDPQLLAGERRINISDKYIGELFELDQKAANEGFLYLLFYFTLMVSSHTPDFFAIDNIDNSLNPKLCLALAKRLNILAKDFDKQIILTTHNPAILDGLDLNDDEQRLFVAYRNDDGHTKIRRIFKPQLPEGTEPVKLSEMFMRGTIGGLPTNF